MGAISGAISGAVGGSTFQQEQELMAEQQAIALQNFTTQTKQAENDNTNQTMSAVQNGHVQAMTAATAEQAQLAQANSKIVA